MTDNVMAKIKQTKGSKDFEFTHYKWTLTHYS
jgi:hypothetical protein